MKTTRYLRLLLWFFLGGVLVLFICSFVLQRFELEVDFEDVKQAFAAKNIELAQHSYATETGRLSYVSAGDPTLPTLVLIHGSPGDWRAWKKLMLSSTLLDDFHLILPDRPPYNASSAVGGQLSLQSQAFQKLMLKLCHPCVLVGHSYGAGLALQLAIDYPEQTKAVVSLAGTVAADYQTPRWYNHVAQLFFARPFLTKGLKASNEEMMTLHNDLTFLEKELKGLTVPIFFLQGGEDVLVNPYSPLHIFPNINHAFLLYQSKWDHFVIWSETDEVVNLIYRASQ